MPVLPANLVTGKMKILHLRSTTQITFLTVHVHLDWGTCFCSKTVLIRYQGNTIANMFSKAK